MKRLLSLLALFLFASKDVVAVPSPASGSISSALSSMKHGFSKAKGSASLFVSEKKDHRFLVIGKSKKILVHIQDNENRLASAEDLVNTLIIKLGEALPGFYNTKLYSELDKLQLDCKNSLVKELVEMMINSLLRENGRELKKLCKKLDKNFKAQPTKIIPVTKSYRSIAEKALLASGILSLGAGLGRAYSLNNQFLKKVTSNDYLAPDLSESKYDNSSIAAKEHSANEGPPNVLQAPVDSVIDAMGSFVEYFFGQPKVSDVQRPLDSLQETVQDRFGDLIQQTNQAAKKEGFCKVKKITDDPSLEGQDVAEFSNIDDSPEAYRLLRDNDLGSLSEEPVTLASNCKLSCKKGLGYEKSGLDNGHNRFCYQNALIKSVNEKASSFGCKVEHLSDGKVSFKDQPNKELSIDDLRKLSKHPKSRKSKCRKRLQTQEDWGFKVPDSSPLCQPEFVGKFGHYQDLMHYVGLDRNTEIPYLSSMASTIYDRRPADSYFSQGDVPDIKFHGPSYRLKPINFRETRLPIKTLEGHSKGQVSVGEVNEKELAVVKFSNDILSEMFALAIQRLGHVSDGLRRDLLVGIRIFRASKYGVARFPENYIEDVTPINPDWSDNFNKAVVVSDNLYLHYKGADYAFQLHLLAVDHNGDLDLNNLVPTSPEHDSFRGLLPSTLSLSTAFGWLVDSSAVTKIMTNVGNANFSLECPVVENKLPGLPVLGNEEPEGPVKQKSFTDFAPDSKVVFDDSGNVRTDVSLGSLPESKVAQAKCDAEEFVGKFGPERISNPNATGKQRDFGIVGKGSNVSIDWNNCLNTKTRRECSREFRRKRAFGGNVRFDSESLEKKIKFKTVEDLDQLLSIDKGMALEQRFTKSDCDEARRLLEQNKGTIDSQKVAQLKPKIDNLTSFIDGYDVQF